MTLNNNDQKSQKKENILVKVALKKINKIF